MPSRSIIRTGVGPHREPGNPFPAMAAAINVLAARVARVQSRRNLSRSLSPKLDHSHSITRFDRSRTGPRIENRITPACPYIFPSARRRSGMAARQVRRSVVMSNLQIRLLPMDSDQIPLRKQKGVLHGAARAAPLIQSVEQPCVRALLEARPARGGFFCAYFCDARAPRRETLRIRQNGVDLGSIIATYTKSRVAQGTLARRGGSARYPNQCSTEARIVSPIRAGRAE